MFRINGSGHLRGRRAVLNLAVEEDGDEVVRLAVPTADMVRSTLVIVHATRVPLSDKDIANVVGNVQRDLCLRTGRTGEWTEEAWQLLKSKFAKPKRGRAMLALPPPPPTAAPAVNVPLLALPPVPPMPLASQPVENKSSESDSNSTDSDSSSDSSVDKSGGNDGGETDEEPGGHDGGEADEESAGPALQEDHQKLQADCETLREKVQTQEDELVEKAQEIEDLNDTIAYQSLRIESLTNDCLNHQDERETLKYEIEMLKRRRL